MEVNKDRITIFDTGPGMDGSDENSIVKWYGPDLFLFIFVDSIYELDDAPLLD